MNDSTEPDPLRDALPPSIAKVLSRFALMGREEKMQALVSLSKKLPPVPERFHAITGLGFDVPECQTPLRLFPEYADNRMHYHAQIDAR
ncbi:MAG: SufE family protein, partial [Gemmatimonadaceae bacterium]